MACSLSEHSLVMLGLAESEVTGSVSLGRADPLLTRGLVSSNNEQ
jgi:hypothetical protein